MKTMIGPVRDLSRQWRGNLTPIWGEATPQAAAALRAAAARALAERPIDKATGTPWVPVAISLHQPGSPRLVREPWGSPHGPMADVPLDVALEPAAPRSALSGVGVSCEGCCPAAPVPMWDLAAEAAETVVVTRHGGLVTYLREEGIIRGDVRVIAHAAPEDVRGKHVVGVLPLGLAALARRVTTVPLQLPPQLRGQELTAAQVREFAGQPETFSVYRW